MLFWTKGATLLSQRVWLLRKKRNFFLNLSPYSSNLKIKTHLNSSTKSQEALEESQTSKAQLPLETKGARKSPWLNLSNPQSQGSLRRAISHLRDTVLLRSKNNLLQSWWNTTLSLRRIQERAVLELRRIRSQNTLRTLLQPRTRLTAGLLRHQFALILKG